MRAFIAGREAELHVDQQERGAASPDDSQLRRAFSEGVTSEDMLPDIILAIERARLRFDDRVDHFDEPGAQGLYDQMQRLYHRHPGLLNESTLEHCQRRLEQLTIECDGFRRQLDELAERAIKAARIGDGPTASWALRRMAAIRALRPALLPDDRYEAIRERIENSADEDEHRAAAKQLVIRERAIAADIKSLARIVRHFRDVTRTVDADDAAFRQAEREFRRAAAAILERDTDWMATLLVEFNELVDEIHDSSGKAEHQVNYFLNSVRESLATLRREVEAIEQRRRQE